VISVVWDKSLSLYFELLPKLGSSNVHEQKSTIFKVLPLLIIINLRIGRPRVVQLSWLTGLESRMYILPASQKKNEFVEVKTEIWLG